MSRIRISLVLVVVLGACSAAPVGYSRGFFEPEPAEDGSTYRWMGPVGVVALRSAQRDMVLVVAGRIPTDKLAKAPAVRLELNGVLLEEIPTPQAVFRKQYDVPVARQAPGISELRIVTSETFVPNTLDPASQDKRRLGLIVSEVSWNPK